MKKKENLDWGGDALRFGVYIRIHNQGAMHRPRCCLSIQKLTTIRVYRHEFV